MKIAIAFVLSLCGIVGTANAGITKIVPPSGATCSTSGFTTDGSQVMGVCKFITGLAARYHLPPANYNYVQWDLTGEVVEVGGLCNTQSPTAAYTNPNGCKLVYPYGPVIVINGVPYSYLSTNYMGIELVYNQTTSYLIAP